MSNKLDEDRPDNDDVDIFAELNQEIEELSSNAPINRDGTWLTSYADLMTLIACFFILLVAFANFEDPSFQEKAQSFAKFFRGAVLKSQGEKEKEVVTGESVEIETIKVRDTEKNQAETKNLATHINRVVKTAGISEIDPPKDIEVIFNGSVMFGPGSVDLSREVEDSLSVMIDLIVERKEEFTILFEGHTDDTDIKNRIYPSNWELSAARAAIILKKFEKAGISSKKLVAVGYGDSRPTYENRDKNGEPIPGNQKLNRRVVIKVLHDKNAPKDNLGLGIFFRDLKGKNIPSQPKSNQN